MSKRPARKSKPAFTPSFIPKAPSAKVKAYSVPNYGSYPDTVVFEGSDPHGTRAQVWDRDTNTSKTLALAAPGAYVEDINWQGMKDRYVSGIGSQIAYGQVAASRALDAHNMTIDPRNPGTGCSLDGVKIDCNKLFREAGNGPNGRISLVFSTTGGRGGVGGDTGALATSFGLAEGQAASTKKYLGRKQVGGGKNDAMTFTYEGFDGADVVVFKDPPRFEDVYANNVTALWGDGTDFKLTGGQQGGRARSQPAWDEPLGKKIAEIAKKNVGENAWETARDRKGRDGKLHKAGTYKCSTFVFDVLKVAGAPAPTSGGKGEWNATAGEWGNPGVDVLGGRWKIVKDGSLKPGDVISNRFTNVGQGAAATGHVAIIGPDLETIGTGMPGGIITSTNWGTGRSTDGIVVRRCTKE
jgi:hypothetical protein